MKGSLHLLNPLLAGVAVLVAFLLVIDLQGTVTRKRSLPDCQLKGEGATRLSKQQLAKLLTIPERDRKQKVKTVLKTPACELPKLEIRAGVPAEREVYQLDFDPQVWLVVLYEGEEYAGYQLTRR